jgi:hypothetical protein
MSGLCVRFAICTGAQTTGQAETTKKDIDWQVNSAYRGRVRFSKTGSRKRTFFLNLVLKMQLISEWLEAKSHIAS